MDLSFSLVRLDLRIPTFILFDGNTTGGSCRSAHSRIALRHGVMICRIPFAGGVGTGLLGWFFGVKSFLLNDLRIAERAVDSQ